jgi:hypothetical protein
MLTIAEVRPIFGLWRTRCSAGRPKADDQLRMGGISVSGMWCSTIAMGYIGAYLGGPPPGVLLPCASTLVVRLGFLNVEPNVLSWSALKRGPTASWLEVDRTSQGMQAYGDSCGCSAINVGLTGPGWRVVLVGFST